MLYRIIKVKDENIFLQKAEGLSTSEMVEIETSAQALGREFGFIYAKCNGQYFTAGRVHIYQSKDAVYYTNMEDFMLQDKFTWLDEEEGNNFRVPHDKFHIFIEID